MEHHAQLMNQAIDVCRKGISTGQSPFGAVVASRSGEIICAVHNTVRADGDPTAHAEVNAIREAVRRLGTLDLSGHLIVSTCEPCPMCAAAIHWARFDAVIFGAAIEDAQDAAFNELPLSARQVYELGHSGVEVVSDVLRDECRGLFRERRNGPNPTPY